MSSLADELASGRTPRVGCSVCLFLSNESPDDQETWKAHMALPVDKMPHTRVLSVMRKRGYPFTSTQALMRHRRESH